MTIWQKLGVGFAVLATLSALPKMGFAADAAHPTVVELFQSQGCSSCPPAEANVAAVSDRPDVLALAFEVDYWDRLGWKDTFSKHAWTERQYAYARAFARDGVYTPQVVVNGQTQVTGSDSRAVQDAIARAATAQLASVGITLTSSQTVSFRISKLPPGSHESEILLAVTEGGLSTPVGGGENVGHTLRHAAVVRTLTSLGKLDPKYPGEYTADARLNLRPEWVRANVKLVLMLQDRVTRRILGAATVKL